MAECDIHVNNTKVVSPIKKHPNKENLDNNPVPVITAENLSKSEDETLAKKEKSSQKMADVDKLPKSVHTVHDDKRLKVENDTSVETKKSNPGTKKRFSLEVSIPLSRMSAETLEMIKSKPMKKK